MRALGPGVGQISRVVHVSTRAVFGVLAAKYGLVQEGHTFLEQTKHKVATKQLYIKDMGKSSSRKLRRVIYHTLYRKDPQKTYSKNDVCTKISEIQKNGGKCPIYSP